MINLNQTVLISYTDKLGQYKQETVGKMLAAELVEQIEFLGGTIINVE